VKAWSCIREPPPAKTPAVTPAPWFGRAARRRLGFGLATLLGIAERGFFIPYRHAGALPGPGARPVNRAMEALFEAARPRFEEVLALLEGQADALEAIRVDPSPDRALEPQARWRQAWFPRVDAALAYALTRGLQPARVVEVGCGHSTRFLARARRDGGLATEITAIDPAPRAELERLQVRQLRATLQACGAAPFAGLAAGDFVMIDSSHILMPGSDVELLLCHILPGLPAGVLVQIHDVFLPDDYPADWAWRGYNEQLAVAALVAGGAWRPLFASHYVATRLAGRLAKTRVGRLPLVPGAHESSLWLEKVAGPAEKGTHAGLTAN